MTIHFRSRIQSPIQHTSKLFPNGYQGCCCTGDIGSSPFQSTLGECNALDGYFKYVPDCNTHICPPKGKTGCCCACSFGGMTSGIQECACEDLGGRWAEGDCSDQVDNIFCKVTDVVTGIEKDLRHKTACCGITLISGITTAYCEEVCTPAECEDNTIPGFSSNFFVGVNTCSDTQIFCSLPPQTNSMIQSPKMELEDYVYGNCCLQGSRCICLENITLKNCINLNGSFYLMGEPEHSCFMCYKNCSRGQE